ncbi:CPBP family intramembrane glutamic endopeptidase [Ekhidna sp.]
MKYVSHIYQLVNRHRVAFFLSLILAVCLIAIGVLEQKLDNTLTYLTVMGLCFLLSEFIYFSGQPVFPQWKIKKPKNELITVILVTLIATSLMIYWFVLVDPKQVSSATRIVSMVLRLLFVFPIFLLIYFLAVKRYKPYEIGIWNFKYWFIGLPLMILIGGITYLTFPEGMQFTSAYQESGIQGYIVLGFLTAAIPEEIARNLFQSRLGKVINSKAVAWFSVSLIWALQHIPYFGYQTDDYYAATISAIGILPIGLLWGYLNERYKSIIPSVIIHGTNLWGLQNIL